MAWIFGIVVGIALGVGIAFYITVSLVKKSNDIGDSSSTLYDVSNGINIIERKDDLHKAF